MDTRAGTSETRTTTCYMCACRCGIRVHLRDGEVRYIDGNPEHPLNQGVICAKGASGIMKQNSPARLTRPLRRRPGAERGAADFEPISWDEAFDILGKRLARIRATDPRKFALFTGPDLDRAKLLVMIGTAEDHHSNPLKIAISKFKRAGGRFVSINPVRTGYSAIADEWVPIRPGTDGALLLALVHELIATGLYDREFVARYTNGGHLIDQDESSERHGLPALAAPYAAGAIAITAAALAGRLRSLARNARLRPVSTLQSAIGVAHPKVRQVSRGFTAGAFNTIEFFHGVDAASMRRAKARFLALAFVLPIALLALGIGAREPAILASAFALQYAGLVLERWYFLADSRHPQNLYYQSIS